MIPLLLLSAALGYALFTYGAVLPPGWAISLLIVSLAALVYRFRTDSVDLAPPLEPYIRWPALLLLGYVAAQLVPLPLPVLAWLSPAKAEIVRALAPVSPGISAGPVSVVPSATLQHLLRVAGYLLTFLLARELTWRFWESPWLAALPVVILASAEAALGMVQYLSDPASAHATGTFVNRNHFAGLMAMVFPLALMYAAAVWHRGSSRHRSPAGPALRASLLLFCAALLLAGAVYSFSRMGFLAALTGLLTIGVAFAGASLRRRSRGIAALAAAVVIVLGVVFLPPGRLIERFAFVSSTDEVSADARTEIWRDTLNLIRAFPLTGCGLGAYESAFTRYQRVAPLSAIDYAHNDYLQFAAELGFAGGVLLAVLAAGVVSVTSRAAGPKFAVEKRYLAIRLCGSFRRYRVTQSGGFQPVHTG